MCGRAYETYSDEELNIRYLNKRFPPIPDFIPTYNLCPTQDSPVLHIPEAEAQFALMRWQLIPNWEPVFKTSLSTINAKSETVFDSALFRDLILRRRCIVPLSGFFEWKSSGKQRQPFRIFRADGDIMSVAGIWDIWRPGTPQQRFSFSILTTAANGFMSSIHDRMPVILSRSDEQLWLDPQLVEAAHIKPLLRPCGDSILTAAEVSSLVNSPKNNSPEILLPPPPAPGGLLFD